MGGEPTFTSRLHPEAPEWNGDALGPTKWEQGAALAEALRARIAPGGILLHRYGKLYPGESLPRWALDIFARRDGAPIVKSAPGSAPRRPSSVAQARRLTDAIAERLGSSPGAHPRGVRRSLAQRCARRRALPVDVDPRSRRPGRDPEERRRLARLLDRGLATEAGFVLPLARAPTAKGGGWRSEKWTFRRERLYLLPGDSPIGLRLPLGSIARRPPPPPGRGLRRDRPTRAAAISPRRSEAARAASRRLPIARERAPPLPAVRTALCVEPRDGRLYVFLPPLASAARFRELVQAIDETSAALDLRVVLEGYPPPKSPELLHIAVTPDPGVLEVNIPPTRTSREHAALLETVFDAALNAGLHAEKYQLDGRQAGSGGGNHITLGGPTPLASPFLRRPDLLASLVTFTQHHPSLSYMFTGLFVGPTSQAPRVDEARHDTLYELEIALARAFERSAEPPAPWLCDALFRHLLVDVSGNTHRAEICIDKLFDPATPHGRQGLVELRAFEMPPHPRMAVAQVALVRALVASFARTPYRAPLVRWGQVLHDRFLLPTWLWRDFEGVLAHLERADLALPVDAFRAFLELRCPIVGALQATDVRLELRNAIEPWHVLGEEMATTGTARFVDSSMERVELRAEGLVPERHVGDWSTASRFRCARPGSPASTWGASASAPGPRPTACTRTWGFITRCSSTSSTRGASVRSAPAPTTSGTRRAAGTRTRRSRASRRARAAPSASPSGTTRRTPPARAPRRHTPTRPTRSICAASPSTTRCRSRASRGKAQS